MNNKIIQSGFASLQIFAILSSMFIFLLIINSAISNVLETNKYVLEELKIIKLSQELVNYAIKLISDIKIREKIFIKQEYSIPVDTHIKFVKAAISCYKDYCLIKINYKTKIIKNIRIDYKFVENDKKKHELIVNARFV